MSADAVGNAAVESTKGTIYQIYIAVKKCLEMKAGQQLYIERYGDVTVGKSEQIEVKHYADNLTDNHDNFWKTLHNWMRPEFDEKQYSSLILCTTQKIGPESKFLQWNQSDLAGRKAILAAILTASESRFSARVAAVGSGEKPALPESLKYQRQSLLPANASKLEEVIGRMFLAHCNPDLENLYAEIRDVHGRGVLAGKRDDFCQALLGFVICPQIVNGSGWTITNEAFSAKFSALTSQYHKETRVFPTKYKRPDDAPVPTQGLAAQPFVQKINEINYAEQVPKAIRDYLYANDTVAKDLSSYERPPEAYRTFSSSVLDQFQPHHSLAKRTWGTHADGAKNFYDQMMSLPVPAFPGFETPDFAFRNGVIHMHQDDRDRKLSWKLT